MQRLTHLVPCVPLQDDVVEPQALNEPQRLRALQELLQASRRTVHEDDRHESAHEQRARERVVVVFPGRRRRERLKDRIFYEPDRRDAHLRRHHLLFIVIGGGGENVGEELHVHGRRRGAQDEAIEPEGDVPQLRVRVRACERGEEVHEGEEDVWRYADIGNRGGEGGEEKGERAGQSVRGPEGGEEEREERGQGCEGGCIRGCVREKGERTE